MLLAVTGSRKEQMTNILIPFPSACIHLFDINVYVTLPHSSIMKLIQIWIYLLKSLYSHREINSCVLYLKKDRHVAMCNKCCILADLVGRCGHVIQIWLMEYRCERCKQLSERDFKVYR